VTATLARCNRPVTVTNTTSASTSYLFTENGSFTFHFIDTAGNTGSTVATVNWIDTWLVFIPFITTRDTRNLSTGSTDEYTIRIPTVGTGYNFEIDWGDGVIDNYSGTAPVVSHPYATGGVKEVKIRGNFPRIYFNNQRDRNKILSVDQWGDVQWTNMANAFYGCENLQSVGNDIPVFTGTTFSMENMFRGATNFNGDLSNWDTSNVTTMASMFY
jgi:surface protein